MKARSLLNLVVGIWGAILLPEIVVAVIWWPDCSLNYWGRISGPTLTHQIHDLLLLALCGLCLWRGRRWVSITTASVGLAKVITLLSMFAFYGPNCCGPSLYDLMAMASTVLSVPMALIVAGVAFSKNNQSQRSPACSVSVASSEVN